MSAQRERLTFWRDEADRYLAERDEWQEYAEKLREAAGEVDAWGWGEDAPPACVRAWEGFRAALALPKPGEK